MISLSKQANYNDKSTEKIFSTVISIDSIHVMDPLAGNVVSAKKEESKINTLIILVGSLIIINIALFVYFGKKFRQSKK